MRKALLFALIVAVVCATAAAASATRISGQVTCISGESVEGVWINSAKGGSGWASWSGGVSNLPASYQFNLPNTTKWNVTVGCGGSPQHWKNSIGGNVWVNGTVAYWNCYDWWMKEFPWHGYCART